MMKSMLTFLFIFASVNAFALDNVEINVQHQVIENAISQINANLSAEHFKQTIEKKYHTTYRFLEKLPQKQQQEVYEFYQNEPNFAAIRHKIFSLFFETL